MGRFSAITAERVDAPVAAPPAAPASPPDPAAESDVFGASARDSQLTKPRLLDAKVRLHRMLIEAIDLSVLEKVSPEELRDLVGAIVSEQVLDERLPLNAEELEDFCEELCDEMTGLGPIEP